MKRLIFATGVGIGYIFGARAGRSRYETIARAARSLADRPEIQSTAGILQAQATQIARSALGRRHDPAAHVSPN